MIDITKLKINNEVRIINVNGATNDPRIGIITKVQTIDYINNFVYIDVKNNDLLKNSSDCWYISELEVVNFSDDIKKLSLIINSQANEIYHLKEDLLEMNTRIKKLEKHKPVIIQKTSGRLI